LEGAPPLQRPGQQDLKDLREIKVRRARTQTATGIEIATGTKTATEMQAHRHCVRRDNIRPRTPAEDGLASETKNSFGLRPEADNIAIN
jgi:hypothetical protein